MRIPGMMVAAGLLFAAQPALADVMSRTIKLPDGSTREVRVLVPRAQVAVAESRGMKRVNATAGETERLRAQQCDKGPLPKEMPAHIQAALRTAMERSCRDAETAIAEAQ